MACTSCRSRSAPPSFKNPAARGAAARRRAGRWRAGPIIDEGHHILDCALPADADPDALDLALKRIPGVVEHGLFTGMAERALLGTPEGGVEVLT